MQIISIDPKIKCLRCGSYIHDTERCWNWKERRWCATFKQLRESCDCDYCMEEICRYCNNLRMFCECRDDNRCTICNEQLKKYSDKMICWWDHTKSPCQFCKLPISIFYYNKCFNFHCNTVIRPLCKECNMPEICKGRHKHDGSLCKICGTLLNKGRCIYGCVNGGKMCIYCCHEGVVNSIC